MLLKHETKSFYFDNFIVLLIYILIPKVYTTVPWRATKSLKGLCSVLYGLKINQKPKVGFPYY